jgi:hypothetical protein
MTSYRVLIPSGIEYPTDPAMVRRLKRGDKVPYAERGNKHVRKGRVVDDIPKESVPILLRKGWIEEVVEKGGE